MPLPPFLTTFVKLQDRSMLVIENFFLQQLSVLTKGMRRVNWQASPSNGEAYQLRLTNGAGAAPRL